MKILLLTLSLIFSLNFAKAQTIFILSFEDPMLFNHVIIPTNPNNKWEIAAPQKTLFTSAFSPTNVIVTDKTNPYPINDTSFFIIKNTAGHGLVGNWVASLSGKYFVNSDSLLDFGKIEFSPNNGTSWISLTHATTYSNSIVWNTEPTLTGNSNGWKYFDVNIASLGSLLNIHYGDTILYKFSFISDNIQTNKDGLMYDDIEFLDLVESIPEIKNDNLIFLYPNPTRSVLNINGSSDFSIISSTIFDLMGNIVSSNNHQTNIDISNLLPGMYFIRGLTDKGEFKQKFIKE